MDPTTSTTSAFAYPSIPELGYYSSFSTHQTGNTSQMMMVPTQAFYNNVSRSSQQISSETIITGEKRRQSEPEKTRAKSPIPLKQRKSNSLDSPKNLLPCYSFGGSRQVQNRLDTQNRLKAWRIFFCKFP